MICSDRLDFQNLRFLLDIQRSIQPLQLSVCQLVDSPGTSQKASKPSITGSFEAFSF